MKFHQPENFLRSFFRRYFQFGTFFRNQQGNHSIAWKTGFSDWDNKEYEKDKIIEGRIVKLTPDDLFFPILLNSLFHMLVLFSNESNLQHDFI